MSRGVIHYTHHVCVAETGKTVYRQQAERGQSNRSTEDLDRYWNVYPSSPVPECGTMCTGGYKAKRFTIERSQVTCKMCLRALTVDTFERFDKHRRDAVQRGFPQGAHQNWANHDERTERAWLLCCRDHGHPYPFSGAKLEALKRSQLAKAIQQHIAIDSFTANFPKLARKALVKSWGVIPDALREPMRIAIDEMTMAADLLEEVERMLDKADAAIAGVRAGVASGALVVDAETAMAHVTAAVAEQQQRMAS